jgi:Mannosyl-glycoprotein endo-beta-N-acetylglucosaminidase
MTAVDLAAWYASTGRQPALTVPLATLADLYQANGVTYGVRDDIAFTQSIIETGYFGFPSGGQVATSDNNFAGIGACDSCHGGRAFADAKSGVAAQLQLLHNYASSQPLPGPLPLTAGPTGCCPTWMSLTGVWATNPSYGFSILTLYKHIVEWVLPRRTVTAGL